MPETTDQMYDLLLLANESGLYDAAQWIEDHFPGLCPKQPQLIGSGRTDVFDWTQSGDDGHWLTVNGKGWFLQHPLACRPNLDACSVHVAVTDTALDNFWGKTRVELDEDGNLVRAP